MKDTPEKQPTIGIKEMRQTARLLTAPVDFADLIRAGVIERRGPWYKVLRWDDLPDHARAQISGWKSGDELLVRFHSPARKPKRGAGPAEGKISEQES